jgi:hypothetical protein
MKHLFVLAPNKKIKMERLGLFQRNNAKSKSIWQEKLFKKN